MLTFDFGYRINNSMENQNLDDIEEARLDQEALDFAQRILDEDKTPDPKMEKLDKEMDLRVKKIFNQLSIASLMGKTPQTTQYSHRKKHN